MNNVTRRNFVLGAATTGAAMSLAGTAGLAFADQPAEAADGVDYVAALGDGFRGMPVKDLGWPLMDDADSPIGFEQREIGADEIAEELNCDVLVIGGGVSGLMAATKAASEGAAVICVEKMSSGRNQWESVGGWGSTSQKEQGINPDPAKYVNAIVTAAGYRARTENIWSFLNNSGAAIDFMQEVLDRSSSGIVIQATGEGDIQGEHTFLNTGAPTWLLGPYVMNALNEAVTTYDNIDMRFKTAGVQLVMDGGRVSGAIVKDMATGTYAKINAAKGVILSTGGYEMNQKMVEAWCRPEDVFSTSMSSTGTGSTGDGHMMGLMVGAGMDPLPHCTMCFGGGYPDNNQFFHAFRTGIFVNARGERFVNEGLMFNFTASAINTNCYRGGVWTIFDQSFLDAKSAANPNLLDTAEYYAESGWLESADSIEELAEKIGVDAGRLAGTIEKWNSYFDAAEPQDLEYMRPLGSCQPFNQAPYYAVKTNSSFLVTVSGLIIDPDSRVLDKNEQPIPGLFATGNTSGGMFADQYPRHLPATSVGRAVTTGFVAGRTAAAE
ncbi:MAG: FAD-binding protein [Coriobacteriales bacterium]|nr:FAD-binding protein [Coriobacteriales bacterium]